MKREGEPSTPLLFHLLVGSLQVAERAQPLIRNEVPENEPPGLVVVIFGSNLLHLQQRQFGQDQERGGPILVTVMDFKELWETMEEVELVPSNNIQIVLTHLTQFNTLSQH